MCVPTIGENESNVQGEKIHKFSKVKNKYMKLYNDMIVDELTTMNNFNIDALTTSTIKWRIFLDRLYNYWDNWRQSTIFKILFNTTQPAHVIVIAAVLCVSSTLKTNTDRISVTSQTHSKITSFIYLGSFVIHFGSQIWMTFVSGLSLYFALPRHTFGEVQRILFPKYFTINACLSLTTLIIFIKHHPSHTWNTEIVIQIFGMIGAFFLELLILLYLTPPLLRLIAQKITYERAAGVGNEIGRHDPGPLKHCPQYLKVHNAFRRVHVLVAVGNMLTMGCTILHLYYIASKLCIL